MFDENEEMDEQERSEKWLNDAMDEYENEHRSDDDDSLDGSDYSSSDDDTDVQFSSPGSVSKDVVDAIWDEHKTERQLGSAMMYDFDKYRGPETEKRCTVMPGSIVDYRQTLSYGYSWIGLHVNDTISVVTFSEPISKRPADKTQVTPYVALVVAVAEMLGLRDPQKSSNGHAVVSVASSAPGQEEFQDAEGAINFLEEKLKYSSSLSPLQTQQIAVCALKYLLGPKFKPNRIDVSGWGNLDGCELLGDGSVCRMSKERALQAISTYQPDLTASITPRLCYPVSRIQDLNVFRVYA